MNKAIKITMIAIFLILFTQLSAQFAAAIGISPAKKNIDFEANKKIDFTFSIVNNDRKDFTAIVYVRGELENYIKIKDPVVKFTSAEDRKSVEFTLETPDKIGDPGSHISEIVILEYAGDIKSEENAPTIQAQGSVAAKLNVMVPFPGKYAQAEMHITSALPNENVVFSIPIFNYGKENIMKAKAVIRILGATYEKIAEFETNSVSIDTKGQAKLTASWSANVNPGTYHAVAEVYYDDQKLTIEKNFNVGSLLVEIEKIDTGKFNLGDIARFDITVASRWNELISNVYGDVTISDKKGTVYGTFKTASVDIEPFEREIITAYWDTKDVTIGKYDLKIAIHYADKVTEQLIEAEVNIDSIRTIYSPTAKVAAAKGGLNKDAMLVILVIILITINVGWFIYFKRSKKK